MRAACLALLLALVAPPAWGEERPIPVVASISILADMVAELGGERVAVVTLVGPGGDAHDYEPSPADAGKLVGARLVVMNGLGLEAWLPRLFAASRSAATLVTATAGIAPAVRDGAPDPHAWQDLSLGMVYVRNIEAALEAADPAHAEAYERRAAAYTAELATLDAWVRARIAAVPAAKRKIITTHDAFGYFGRAYGIEFRAPVGMSEEAEPSAADLARLIRQIRREGVKALFIENMTDPRLIERLARETGTTLGGTLYADALSPPGEGAETYVAMFRSNVPRMVEAMGRN
jgi:zinc/manganese transport system substrate-binding protein